MNDELRHERAGYLKLSPYQEILSGIHTCLGLNEGIIKLVGESGTGKTALCRQLSGELQRAGRQVITFYRPPDSSERLQELVALRLGLDPRANFTAALTRHLRDHDAGARLVMIFDDAETLADDALLAIRMLANIQTESRGLVQLVLCGAPALDQRLATASHRSLVQYLEQSFLLPPMNRDETEEFCLAVMQHSGLDRLGLEADAVNAVYRLTRGHPGEVLALWRKLGAVGEVLPAHLDATVIRKYAGSMDEHGSGLPRSLALAGLIVLLAGSGLWSYLLLRPLPQTLTPAGEIQVAATPPAVPAGENAAPVESASPAPALAETVARDIAPEPATMIADASDAITPPALERSAAGQDTALARDTTTDAALDRPLEASPPAEDEDAPAQALRDFVSAWLDSWESQEMEAYFSHYHAEFSPLYDPSPAAWRADRRARVPAPRWIELEHERFEVIEADAGRATVRFWMHFNSPGYEDRTWKELRLRATDAGWKILVERNLETSILRA